MIQDNDYNLIRPVESTQNVGATTPIDKHAQKRKQPRQEKNSRKPSADNQNVLNESPGRENPDFSPDRPGSIDYRA
jgi:hypothetical protein